MTELEWAGNELLRLGLGVDWPPLESVEELLLRLKLEVDWSSLESVEKLQAQWKKWRNKLCLALHPDHAGQEKTKSFQNFNEIAKKLDDIIREQGGRLRREAALGPEFMQRVREREVQKQERERRKKEEEDAERLRQQREESKAKAQQRVKLVVGAILLSSVHSKQKLRVAAFSGWCLETQSQKINKELSNQVSELQNRLEKERVRNGEVQHVTKEILTKLESLGRPQAEGLLAGWFNAGKTQKPTLEHFKQIVQQAIDDQMKYSKSLEKEKQSLAKQNAALKDDGISLQSDVTALKLKTQELERAMEQANAESDDRTNHLNLLVNAAGAAAAEILKLEQTTAELAETVNQCWDLRSRGSEVVQAEEESPMVGMARIRIDQNTEQEGDQTSTMLFPTRIGSENKAHDAETRQHLNTTDGHSVLADSVYAAVLEWSSTRSSSSSSSAQLESGDLPLMQLMFRLHEVVYCWAAPRSECGTAQVTAAKAATHGLDFDGC